MNIHLTYPISHYQRFIFFSILTLWGCSPTQENTANNSTAADSVQVLQFADYPELKLGFTTQNFLPVLPVSLENSKQLIDYAAEEGYAWIELRDPNAELTVEEAQQLSDYAQEKNIEVSYAIQKGLLDDDFWPTFTKGVKNAAVFEGPGIIRSLGSFAEFNADTSKQGWTAEELDQLVIYADSAATMAQDNGLQYVIENASESFFGKNSEYFGIADFFARTSENVGWQFDTANPFSVSRVHPPADSVQNFLKEHADNLYYIHLKSAQNGQAQPTLMENPLAFDTVFQIMSENNVPYVAIELQAVDNQEQAFGNMEESVNYLKQQGFIANP